VGRGESAGSPPQAFICPKGANQFVEIRVIRGALFIFRFAIPTHF